MEKTHQYLLVPAPLNLPPAKLRLQEVDGKTEVFDGIRKKFVQLTPEEWVRQHFVHFMMDDLGYPRTLINLETGLSYNKRSKRTDIVIYNRQMEPHIIVECKSPSVKLDQKVFDQIGIYNATLKAEILIVTNGLIHFCAKVDHENRSYTFLRELPYFEK